ncbi:potentiating neddylation domain-containing protein [Mycena albidolilacea]|uniref:Defective in cullin neddylation protein n=1 Tax=Mycena albidolilacea TaxID=1033008 RepID=A0AAD7ESC2_9AGAR|nr:potentiating neddylation domain-containing protein [Mycena albidolilacea]
METSTALWSVLLVPQYPIISEVLEFITEKGTYKATNKDLWSMMLEFCRTVEPSLQDYEADGAWPTLLDDFVAWKKAKLGNGTAEAE